VRRRMMRTSWTTSLTAVTAWVLVGVDDQGQPILIEAGSAILAAGA
jgi:hypothetical protein